MSNITQAQQAAMAKAAAVASNQAALVQRNKEAAALQLRIIQSMLAQRPSK
jgi:hypothetical protein